MTREEVRAELEKNGLLKSTEWFSARILPMLLEDKRLRESLAAKDAEIDRLEQKLQAANDEIVTRGIEIERVLRALAAKDAEIEQLKGLLQEWLAAYLEEFGEPDPAYFDRLDRAYVAAKEALAGTGETRGASCGFKECPDGDIVMFCDHEAALAAKDAEIERIKRALVDERQRCRKEEVEPLSAAMPPVAKLKVLADWFDAEQKKRPEWGRRDEVQRDLRKWASAIAAAHIAVRAVQEDKP